jgi:3-methyladenine DNA glycosylase AlkD
MSAREVLQELRALGKEQTAKTYRRHGAQGEVFGVSHADHGKLRKRIRVDHALAGELWASGNHDARILATMIADPARLDSGELNRWVKDLDSYLLCDAFAGLASLSPAAHAVQGAWRSSPREWVGRTGWLVFANLTQSERPPSDGELEDALRVIERDIHGARNWVRAAMNSALIAIGIKDARLERLALAAAGRIGTVHVDHGETACKTPDAAGYIAKVAAHRARR